MFVLTIFNKGAYSPYMSIFHKALNVCIVYNTSLESVPKSVLSILETTINTFLSVCYQFFIIIYTFTFTFSFSFFKYGTEFHGSNPA